MLYWKSVGWNGICSARMNCHAWQTFWYNSFLVSNFFCSFWLRFYFLLWKFQVDLTSLRLDRTQNKRKDVKEKTKASSSHSFFLQFVILEVAWCGVKDWTKLKRKAQKNRSRNIKWWKKRENNSLSSKTMFLCFFVLAGDRIHHFKYICIWNIFGKVGD